MCCGSARLTRGGRIHGKMENQALTSVVRAMDLPQKMSKVKASDKLSFPLRLDLAPILAPDGPPGSQRGGSSSSAGIQDTEYELMSILIHKGPSASHGHYGALICPSGLSCRAIMLLYRS